MLSLITFSIAGLSILSIAAIDLTTQLKTNTRNHRLGFFSTAALSSLSILSSIASLLSQSTFSTPLSLQSIAVAALFLTYSVAGLTNIFPSLLLDLVLSFAFGQQLLLFYLRPKDVDGVENRYFDLFIVPTLVCVVTTAFAAARPSAMPPRIARAAGLALQGTWLIQMGFSFFTSFISSGCSVHRRSSVDYTIKCKTHQDYHRGRAIATLQFNCHLAILVAVGAAVYGVVVAKTGTGAGGVGVYRPLGNEMESMADTSFVLDSEEEGDEEVAGGAVGSSH